MADTWRDKVGRVLEEARKRPPEERAAFLEERCEEEALREEVASLLEAHEEASGLFVDLAAGAAASALGEWIEARSTDGGDSEAEESTAEASDPLGLEGERVGGYDVEEHLGGGGMGVVYRARDGRLGRPVALKFLPPHLARQPEADERFAREARAAAALEHPHVATIHEIGQTENGRRYIAMAYYEGETLKQTIERTGALPVEEAICYAEQMAEALSAAHEAGIVHRDVKPANVMVTEDGAVKLLDFGLAQAAAETRLTETGRQPGTAAYMSPEQARGEEVDSRTDLWALGALLYEMLTGERPFEGTRRTAILHAILHEEPPPLAERRPEIPGGLAKVVHRCLEKSADNRYASAETLRDDLRTVASEEPLAPTPAKSLHATGRDRFPRRWLVGGLAVLLLAAIGAVGWALWPVGETGGTPTASTVAVLPFEVSGAGAETWRDGMVTTLSLNLDGAAGLRAIADRTVFAAWEERGASDEGTSTERALGVAQDVGAKYAIVGSAVQLGGELRLAAEVRRAATGERLGQVDVQGPPESMTALTDRLTRKVLGVLLEKSEDRLPSVNLASITTASLQALKDYLAGERHLRAGEYEAATTDFEAAVRRDSSFALAYARLWGAYRWTGPLPEADRMLQRAYERSDRLPRRERRMVRIKHLYSGLTETDSLRRLSEDYPNDPRIWYELGENLYHAAPPFYGGFSGGLPEAERAFEQAVRLDSGAAHYHHHLVSLAFTLHHDSARTAQRIAAHPGDQSVYKRPFQLSMDLVYGAPATRKRALQHLDTLSIEGVGDPLLVGIFEHMFRHPTDGTLQERVLRRLKRREDIERNIHQRFTTLWLAMNRFEQGQAREGLTLVREEPVDSTFAGCLPVWSETLGISVEPGAFLRHHLDSSPLGEARSLYPHMCRGIHLLEHGQSEEFQALLTRLREAGQQTGTGGLTVERVLRELRGYRAWTSGNLRKAADLWNQSNPSFYWGAVWRGDLYRKLDRLETAEGWYQAAWWHPVTHERLGRLYEKMGKPTKARAAYQRFIEAWKNADPALQGRVETARQRLDALSSTAAAE